MSLLKISSAVLLATSVSWGLAQAQPACAPSPVYAGPPMRSAPDAVWQKDFRRSIDGELPAGLQASLGNALDKMLQHVPAASVAVAIPGEGTWSATRGLARKEPPQPVAPEQPFQVASTAKTLTAAVVLQLVEERKLALGDTIDRWFPDAPNAGLITIEQLLRHTCSAPAIARRSRSRCRAPCGCSPGRSCGAGWRYAPRASCCRWPVRRAAPALPSRGA